MSVTPIEIVDGGVAYSGMSVHALWHLATCPVCWPAFSGDRRGVCDVNDVLDVSRLREVLGRLGTVGRLVESDIEFFHGLSAVVRSE